ncbi:MAG TPA: divalent metal cation transporter [Terriglobales bacterium]|nr:divalent metal cation transporter [Terriglobales bacterium]
MRFPKFPRTEYRKGTPQDRGRVVQFPGGGDEPLPRQPWLRRLLPGVVTGAADVDPALVLTATVAGAMYQYSTLWVVLLCVPFLLNVFRVTARIGHQTRQGLVDLLRLHYGRRVALACALLVIAINMAMIVADLMAVSEAMSIIAGQSRMYFVALAAFSIWYMLIFRDYVKITKALLFLALPLFIYVAAALIVAPAPRELVLRTLVPEVPHSAGYMMTVIALAGSLLTPYILVWNTSSRREQAIIGHELHAADSHAGTVVTTLLSYCIILAAGATLAMKASGELTVRRAAEALRPAVGDLGGILFALGILGAGMVALPILVASMCYAISEAMEWKAGLSEHPWEAGRFYALISAALFLAAFANLFPINPVTAMFWSQALAGVLVVPILIFTLVLANDRRVMRTVNSFGENFWIGAAAGGMCAAVGVYGWMKIF